MMLFVSISLLPDAIAQDFLAEKQDLQSCSQVELMDGSLCGTGYSQITSKLSCEVAADKLNLNQSPPKEVSFQSFATGCLFHKNKGLIFNNIGSAKRSKPWRAICCVAATPTLLTTASATPSQTSKSGASICECKNGIATSCEGIDQGICNECFKGFHLFETQCVPNKCQCENGDPGKCLVVPSASL